mmetsp:Transcript_75594/g.175270  ORF Transcript_75594/g.175270 Transcript_75594/m.175270 type:complete len:489 (+) Transcript_75594:112-1578(+)|eukprot:CAMPEP_0171119676 /NCGR_PEP_ID=MMETSP0766_2-20121228/97782_1 /TAXON_ID=439317 /ORGANISM="Gambierdiscus australes, Strain CAWD 149" /LENGTH=488 /DNA_ID=CAMNT_0011582359 /DNA_START=93 /DNA_END=1559 /DNA_ORIENTATION=-
MLTLQMGITTEIAGRLIGKGGSRITSLRKESGASFKIESEEHGGFRMGHLGGSQSELTSLLEDMFSGSTERFPDEVLDVRLLIHSTYVGAIIGRGGGNIATIRQSTGAHVEIERTPPGHQDELRAIECSGTCQQLKRALVEIVTRMDEENASGNNPGNDRRRGQDYGGQRQGYDQGQPRRQDYGSPRGRDYSPPRDRMHNDRGPGRYGRDPDARGADWGHEDMYRHPVGMPMRPYAYGGMPIGARGYNPGGWGSPPMGWGPHHPGQMMGGCPPPPPEWGHHMGWRGYDGDRGSKRGYQEEAHQGVLVLEMSNELAGCIIGRGGATISSIRRNCGGRIEVREAHRHSVGERVVIIDGNEDEVQHLVAEVFEHLAKPSGREWGDAEERQIEVTLVVPSFQMGALLGHGGKNINRIRSEAGAKVSVDSAGPSSRGIDRTASISGSAEEVKRALKEVARTFFDEGKVNGQYNPEEGSSKRRREDPRSRSPGW